MLSSDVQRWQDKANWISRECGWDASLLLTIQPDERTLVIQVRKSSLLFTVRQDSPGLPRYTVTYTEYASRGPADATVRRMTAGQARSAAFVEEEIEKWLRRFVAQYAAERGSPA